MNKADLKTKNSAGRSFFLLFNFYFFVIKIEHTEECHSWEQLLETLPRVIWESTRLFHWRLCV